jgi:hypothetical protein
MRTYIRPPSPLLAAHGLCLILLLVACSGSGDKKKDDAAPKEVAAAGETVAEPGKDPAATESAVDGPTSTRTLAEVEKAFGARKEGFRRANSARISQNAGTIAVTATFAASGEVVECRMLSTDFREDPEFNAAVMTEVWRLRIPPRAADAGEFILSSYPIAFAARTEAAAVPPSTPILSPAPAPAPAPSSSPPPNVPAPSTSRR